MPAVIDEWSFITKKEQVESHISMLKRIKSFFYRNPDSYIGGKENPYLLRWHIIPRNRWFNIYLHKFLRDDDDRAMHDHPWYSVSLLVKGQYIEQTDAGRKLFKVPRIIFRSATYKHRIELIDNKPTWTIFITGPMIREWGFHCPKGWVHWKSFVSKNDKGKTGKGCD